MCLCVCAYMHVHLWKAQSVNADFTDLRGNECVLLRDTRPHMQFGKNSPVFVPTPYTLAILLPELQFLNQNLYTSEKRVIGMCLSKGLTTKRGHFSVSTFVPSDCSILRSGL